MIDDVWPHGTFTLGEIIEQALVHQGATRTRFLDEMLGPHGALRDRIDSIVRLGSVDGTTPSSNVAIEIARRYRALVRDARAEAPPITLFLRYLDRCDAGETITIDRLCEAHPEEAEDLRAIGRRWVDFRSALKPGSDTERDQSERCARDLLQLICTQTDSGRRYTQVRDLGQGGMGKVAEVMDLRLGRSVAKKTPSGQGPEGFLTIRRLLKEARITALLEHPGVVPVHELGVGADGTPYFTMRVVVGVTLRHAIRSLHEMPGRSEPSGPWRTRESLLSTLVKICDTVAYAHARGVIHRDLKPDNILLGRFGEAYVMDWGLAHDMTGAVTGTRTDPDNSAPSSASAEGACAERDPDEAMGLDIDQLLAASCPTHAADIVGTPCFMPPEHAATARQDPAVTFDVYSLGAILYQVLTGVAPYADLRRRPNAQQTVERLRRGPPRPIADISSDAPDELIAICEKAMARSPERRYPTVCELRDDLVAFLEGRVVRAHSTGARMVARKWAARNPTLATALIALLLMSTTLALVMFEAEKANSAAVETQARLDLEKAHAAKIEARQQRIELDNRFFADGEKLDNAATIFNSLGSSPYSVDDLTDLHGKAMDAYSTLSAIDEHIASLEGLGDIAQVSMLRAHRSRVSALSGESNGRFCIPLLERLIDRASWSADDLPETEIALWVRAFREISLDPRFRGVPLSIHADLIPLGRDPASRLQEFALKGLMPGPEADWLPIRGEDGTLHIHEGTTIVFVLVPPATRYLGMVDERFRQPGQDSTLHPVSLPAYLIAKYELTHAQLFSLGASISESDPNKDGDGRAPRPAVGCTARSSLIPIGRYRLRFPTVDEWEHAARGDNEGPFPGNRVLDLSSHANSFGLENAECRDATRSRESFDQTTLDKDLRDGRVRQAPINENLPNSFGLYNALGNVAEICVLQGQYYALGGSFDLPYFELRYSARRKIAMNIPHADVGFRLVRDFEENARSDESRSSFLSSLRENETPDRRTRAADSQPRRDGSN